MTKKKIVIEVSERTANELPRMLRYWSRLKFDPGLAELANELDGGAGGEVDAFALSMPGKIYEVGDVGGQTAVVFHGPAGKVVIPASVETARACGRNLYRDADLVLMVKPEADGAV